MKMIMTFPGDAQVDARFDGFVVTTDQPRNAGGGGSAPAPFDYFLASLGTCAGFYVSTFLQKRGLPLDEVEVSLEAEKNPDTGMTTLVRLNVELPASFPRKYEWALLRAIDQCTVKKHLLDPPTIETVLDVQEPTHAQSRQLVPSPRTRRDEVIPA